MERYQAILHKINDLESTQRIVKGWQMKGQKVVFTNGCFDILHTGHVTYLVKAADLGHRLVVGLNTDQSVKRQGKGDERPINHEDARLMVLASLGFVDAVILFDEDTPLNLIEALAPDILVKGGDYDAEERDTSSKNYIVGSDFILQNGGKVSTIDLVEGFSTTAIVNKLKK